MPTGLATPSDLEAARRRVAVSTPVGRISPDSSPGGGFAPGTVLADRYRVIGLIGRGGMGEVYRADDLKLGQPVALKFLPRHVAGDASFVQRFYAEVRHARQVSHPNVCRVYDVGEIEGRHYLSMEYVDGEDLASLLRRIGRLGHDKALELARQLCAGLAAAHDKEVLHRDLKPANVMIDGRGRARITDFGLAVAADEEHAEGELSGTPAYMAPEQLAGRAATVQSDIYALGLVLYELFTGRRAFEAATLAEWKHKHAQEPPPSPSTAAREVDPVVERVVLRCLEKDPRERPRSVLSVAAALPGGDPLAAALAAGETPSPEMVAASGETGGLKPVVALTLLSAVLLGLVAGVLLLPIVALHGAVPLEKTADALVERSRTILNRVGYVEKPADSAFAFEQNGDYLRYVEKRDRSPGRWEDMGDGRPAGIHFWYRQSPRSLVARDFFAGAPFNGQVSLHDPEPAVPGMALVIVDTLGRLLRLEVVPPERRGTPTTAPASPNWAVLFEEAGLDPAKFSQVAPEWLPPTYADARTAWWRRVPSREGRLFVSRPLRWADARRPSS
jgi:serine/threonine-protein kinase